jgi:hypothetical protein
VRRQWDLEQIQYLNSFPRGSWQPADWPDEWVVVMDGRGRIMQEWFKEPRARRRVGRDIRLWRDRLVLIQGAADRGNIFVLVQNRRPRGQVHGYMLCPIWLDSHFSLEKLKVPVRRGASFEVAYAIGIWGHKGLSRAEAIRIGQRALATGALGFWEGVDG